MSGDDIGLHQFSVVTNVPNAYSDEEESPTKSDRHYELQRKIDEELRKLQLADGMAEAEKTEDHLIPNGLIETSEGTPYHSKHCNGSDPQCQESGENQNYSQQMSGFETNCYNASKQSEEGSVIECSVPLAVADNEIEHQTDSAQMSDVIEFHEEKSVTGDTSAHTEIISTAIEGDQATQEDLPVNEAVYSVSVLHSSTVTSPTTTADALSLTTHTPGSQSGSTEQSPSDLPLESLNGMDPVREVQDPKDVKIQEKPIDVATNEMQGECKDSLFGSSVDPEVSFQVETGDDLTTTDSALITVEVSTDSFVQSEGNMESAEDSNDCLEDEQTRDINQEMICQSDFIYAENQETTKPCGQTSAFVDPFIQDTGELDTEEFPPVGEESVLADSAVPFDAAANSETDTSDNSAADRKISTDEDEYSGYDIDIISSQEETITVDIPITTQCDITKACDNENIPIFADTKYSIGEQPLATAFHGMEDEEIVPAPVDYDFASAPWDSSGRLECRDLAVAVIESLRSDKAESTGSNCRSSLSEDFTKNDACYKIAEETVSNAIKDAFDVYTGNKEGYEQLEFTSFDKTMHELNFKVSLDRNDDTGDKISTLADTVNDEVIESSSSSENEGDESGSLESTQSNLSDQQGEKTETSVDDSTSIDITSVTQGSVVDNVEESLATGIVDSELDADESHSDELSNISISPHGNLLGIQASDTKEDKLETPLSSINVDTVSVDHTNQEYSPAETDDAEDFHDMVKINESTGHERNLPERITYNPALSQRNTEATKWFGQPTSENKIWMKPTGKLDHSAEMERKRLIKAMTRRNNPNLVPKWEPPKEKDIAEDFDEKQKESLKKYEERRKSRIHTVEPVENNIITTAAQSVTDAEQSELSPSARTLRENIIVEPVVHSKDAISVWESRLIEKQQKEELEKQRLSGGKGSWGRQRASSEVNQLRQDSSSSISSTGSALLTSEHIERESMDISKVRNRWKHLDESNKVKPVPVVTKTNRRFTFSVGTAQPFRSFQSPAPTANRPNVAPVNARNTRVNIFSASEVRESYIDREIRETAEREERWKMEHQWEKMSEISAASSEEPFTEMAAPVVEPKVVPIAAKSSNIAPPLELVELELVKKSIEEESNAGQKALQAGTILSPASATNQGVRNGSYTFNNPVRQGYIRTEENVEPVSSSGSGDAQISSMPSDKAIANDLNCQDASDSGIDEESNITVDVKVSPAFTKSSAVVDGSLTTVHAEIKETEQNEEKDLFKRKRLSSLTNALSPKGWEPTKNRSPGPLSSVNPVHRSVPRPETKKHLNPRLQSVEEVAAPKMETTTSSGSSSAETKSVNPPTFISLTTPAVKDEKNTEELVVNGNTTKDTQTVLSPSTGVKKGGPIFIKKSGGAIEVSSSKSQLQTIMAREMQDAAVREEEWRKKQMELVNKGVDISSHPVVHSTREIRTPTGSAPPPPVNSSESANGVKLRRPVGRLFDDNDGDDTLSSQINTSDEFKKREVVKAMRVPKRKSLLAMRWEEGQFQNTVPDTEE